MSRSRRKRKYSGGPCSCWLCSPRERVLEHHASKRRVEIREGHDEFVGGMVAGPTPAARAKETLQLLREGRHEELAWQGALANARQQRE